MRAAVIVNPTKVSIDVFTVALAAVEQRHGFEPSLLLTTTLETDAETLAVDVLDADIDLVVACGGDGTVRLVVGALADATLAGGPRIPLGIVPLGTGNLLARNVGISPNDPLETQLERAFIGTEREIDACQLRYTLADGTSDAQWFAVIAGMGVDAGMVKHTDSEVKKRIGWLAYLGGVARSLRAEPHLTARFRIDHDRTYGARAASVMFVNCGMLQGGVALVPDAAPDDGRLHVLVARPRGTSGWFALLGHTLLASLARIRPPLRKLLQEVDARDQVHARGGGNRAVTGDSGVAAAFAIDSAPEPLQLDGDLVGDVRSGVVTVHPAAVTVRL